jgi:hypothetical protein
MVTRLIGTTKVVAAGLALAVLLCWVPGSQAAVFTGAAADPAGDLSLDLGDGLPIPPVDFTNVVVRYDDVAGRVDLSYTFSQTPAVSQDVVAGVGLGSIQANGECSAPEMRQTQWIPYDFPPQGQAAVWGRSSGFAGSVSGFVSNFAGADVRWESTAMFDWPGTENRTWNFATRQPALEGKHYTCVRAAMWLQGGGDGIGADWFDGSVFALQPAAVTSPSAEWIAPRDGQTVSGRLTERGPGAQNCEARVVGLVVRTENYVDGRLNDTQVTAPWSCEWDTRNYVNGGHLLTVKAYDAANNVIATDTIRVTVNNPNPPPVNNPPPPTVESPGTSPSDSKPKATPGPRFTALKARRAVKRALARRYGKAFRLRKGYTTTCLKTNPSSWSCTVRWRYGEYIYKGKIKLRLRSDGRIASRVVLRKTFK